MFNQKNKNQIITSQWYLFSVYSLSRAAFDFMKGRMQPAGHMFDMTGLSINKLMALTRRAPELRKLPRKHPTVRCNVIDVLFGSNADLGFSFAPLKLLLLANIMELEEHATKIFRGLVKKINGIYQITFQSRHDLSLERKLYTVSLHWKEDGGH